jgi:hypothetical protein
MKRKISSVQIFGASEHAAVANAYVNIVIKRVRERPNLSVSTPNAIPPIPHPTRRRLVVIPVQRVICPCKLGSPGESPNSAGIHNLDT